MAAQRHSACERSALTLFAVGAGATTMATTRLPAKRGPAFVNAGASRGAPSRHRFPVTAPAADAKQTVMSSAHMPSSASSQAAWGGCVAILVGAALRHSRGVGGQGGISRRGRVSASATALEGVQTESPEAVAEAVEAPKPKAKAKARGKAKAKPKKNVPGIVEQATTGLWSPIITLGFALIGDECTKAVRSKGILVHSYVITEFCKTFFIDNKRRQKFIKTAKSTGHDFGMLIEGGNFGDGLLGPQAMQFWKESGLEKWKP